MPSSKCSFTCICGILFALKPFHDYSLCSVCILPQPTFYSQSAVCSLHSVCILPLVRSLQSAVRSLRFTLTAVQLGRHVMFNIRVRIVYESWSRFVVSSIKSSAQKTSLRMHRVLAPDRFCKKDANPFCFFPWQFFALAFSLKALLHFTVFKMVAQGSQRIESVHFNCKARKAL